MSAPRYDLASGRQSRLWSNRLWILAALLFVGMMVHLMGVVHDTRAWRAAVDGVVQATAEQHAERVNERLQLYALETFSPLVQSVGEKGLLSGDLAELARVQRAGELCKCRNMLPVAEFFRVDLPSGVVTRKVTEGQYSAIAAVPDSVLADLAINDAAKLSQQKASAVRLTLGGVLDSYAVVTNVQKDSADRRTVVYGLTADARPFMFSLFSQDGVRLLLHSGTSGLARLDTLSLQVGRTDSTPLYGRLSPDRPFRAKVFLHGPMDGLGVTVALASSQTNILHPVQSPARLWALAAFLSSTLLVVIIAVTTSRREMFLARARSDFIAGTSHDLRMPLAQILLAGETLNLRPEVSEDERTGLSKSIVRETRRLIGMVENVLLYSRSGAVEIKPVLQDIVVADLFDDVRDSVQLAADEHRQTIQTVSGAGVIVRADSQLLRQALVNLVDNAMKYGKPHQAVRLSAEQHSLSLVRLTVDDEGPGIPESQRARVFEPYERLIRDQASAHAGSGLGLAVVYHIAKVCGGKVWIADAPGGGARVIIELQSAQP
ncbi:MAG: HAMP domain-containing histidine kinase [Phycisphaerae bacterium]|nr:HAMP domain-containing histidine kinase [Gemmatimonadaceae bacterium]